MSSMSSRNESSRFLRFTFIVAVGSDDEIFLPVGDPDVLLIVHDADVAGMQPAVLERPPRRLGILVVTGEDARTAEKDFAVFGDADLRLDRRRADGPDHDIVGRRDDADGRVLGHAPGLADVDTDRVEEAQHLGSDRRRATHRGVATRETKLLLQWTVEDEPPGEVDEVPGEGVAPAIPHPDFGQTPT